MEVECTRLFEEIRKSQARIEKGQAEITDKVNSLTECLLVTNETVTAMAATAKSTHENVQLLVDDLLGPAERDYQGIAARGHAQKAGAKGR